MERYDLIVIGAGTSGAKKKKKMARRGRKVLVLEQLSKESVGTKYDIFHIEQREFARLELPRPEKGDPEWAFEFEKNYNADPLTLYKKCQKNHIVGLHMHEYTVRMNDWAAQAGARFVYGAAFTDFTFGGDGKIARLGK